MKDMTDTLLGRATQFSVDKGLSLATISNAVCGNPRALERLQQGGSVTLATYQKFIRAFDDPDHWESLRSDAKKRHNEYISKRRASK